MTAAPVSIGVHVHSEPDRLRATLANLRAHTPADAELLLLPDGPDPPTRIALGALDLPQLGTDVARGAPACFNRLAAATDAPVLVLLESGSLVAPGWLDRLLDGIASAPACGLAGPSTNLSWNAQAAFPKSGASATEIAATAERARRQFAGATHPLAPLHSLADFCYLVRREVIAAIGDADEDYGVGPCWEMDYNIRAARAGFAGVWVGAAYVHRLPSTVRRRREEMRLFEANRRRYQDKFCGHRLRNERHSYERHCKGDDCQEFAPPALITLRHPPLPCAPQTRAPAPDLPAAAVPVIEAGSQPPLVTCIMPTYDRKGFVPQAIRYFLRQDFTDSELLILDDGPDPVASVIPAHPRIRHVRVTTRQSVGAKRNQACHLARGELIAHWDDDDWYPPSRLRRQLEALRAAGADVCGSSEELFYQPVTDRAWRYRYGGPAGRFLAGATLLYRRAVWQRSPFPEIQIGEDMRFVSAAAGLRPGALVDLADQELAVGVIHGGNTSPKQTHAPYWSPVASERIHRLLGDDLPFYRATAAPAGETPPLVSCIMPTGNRRQFVGQSLRRFAEQDYPRRELIVVDDGEDSVEDLVLQAAAAPPAGAVRIRYLRMPKRTSIGAKRNAACAEARGAIIVHWDDDDWYGPDRLSLQAAPILAGDADLTGFENSFVLELPAARFWTIHPDLHRRMFVGDVHGGTLAYRRALFERGFRYPPANLAEDAVFIKHALRAGQRLVRLPNPGVFIYVRHGDNAWRFKSGQFIDRGGWKIVDQPDSFPDEALAIYREIAESRSQQRLR